MAPLIDCTDGDKERLALCGGSGGDMRDGSLKVSIIIKALNEERHIAAAIESALVAAEGMESEVILADCASTDRTLAILASGEGTNFEALVDASGRAGYIAGLASASRDPATSSCARASAWR